MVFDGVKECESNAFEIFCLLKHLNFCLLLSAVDSLRRVYCGGEEAGVGVGQVVLCVREAAIALMVVSRGGPSVRCLLKS